MREILFRGKRIDNDEWVYGSFCMDAVEQKNGPCGMDGFIRLYDFDKGKMQMHEVDRDTVGQYTGLADKNGVKIFEDDLVLYKDDVGGIVYRDSEAMFCVSFDGWYADFGHLYGKGIEIIGNIHDNPELLTKEA